jgi:hypothetical protein
MVVLYTDDYGKITIQVQIVPLSVVAASES